MEQGNAQDKLATRKFAILMENNELNNLRQVFIKFRDYENEIVRHIMSNPYNESYNDFIQHFENMGKIARKKANQHFGIEQLETGTYKRVYLNSRAKRSAFIYPYTAIRENIIRWEYLKQIGMLLPEIFRKDPSEFTSFISKGKLNRENSLFILDKIKYTCYNAFEKKSIAYLTILMGQLKNIMLKEHVFQYIITDSLRMIESGREDMLNSLLNSFTFKKKKKEIPVKPTELGVFFKKLYIHSIKSTSTRNFNLYQNKRIKSTKSKNRHKEILKLKPSKLVESILHNHDITDGNDFKELQGQRISELFEDNHSSITLKTITEWSEKIFAEIIRGYLDIEDSSFEKSVLKPQFSKFYYDELSVANFNDFIKNQLKNNIKSLISGKIIGLLNQNQLSTMVNQFVSDSIETSKNIPIPQFKKLTFPLADKDRILTQKYEDSVGTFIFHPSGKTKKAKQFTLSITQNTLNRLDITDEDMFKFQFQSNPVFKFLGRKLIVAQPIVKNNAISNATTYVKPGSHSGKQYVMGIDLGLKHYAVLSIWEIDNENPSNTKEIARYFINHRTIFKQHFNSVTGRFESKNSNSNVPRKLYHLKKEISGLQKKKSIILRDHPSASLSPYKLSKGISSKWLKINNIHAEIANQVSVLIKRLATFHGVSVIKFEDLRWSKHSKKRDSGFYLTQNQMHFIHSQIITKTKDLVENSASIKVELVNARWTSQLCSNCFRDQPIAITYHTEKQDISALIGNRAQAEFNHTCRDGNHRNLNSDLNAARVIALSPVLSS